MSNETAVVFTSKSVERILKEGGTSSWRLDRNHARRCAFVVCTRNASSDWAEGPEDHRAAFLVGKVRDVVPSSEYQGRYLIEFAEYAQVNIPNVWKNDRNPVRYVDIRDLGIDPEKLNWQPLAMPSKSRADGQTDRAGKSRNSTASLTLEEAKRGLALTFGVSPEAVEITIRG